jgi:hypothetical protein
MEKDPEAFAQCYYGRLTAGQCAPTDRSPGPQKDQKARGPDLVAVINNPIELPEKK